MAYPAVSKPYLGIIAANASLGVKLNFHFSDDYELSYPTSRTWHHRYINIKQITGHKP